MGARPSRLLAVVALVATALLAAPRPAAAIVTDVLYGKSRYSTAVAVSKASYPATSTAAVLANGTAWADALGGSALAGAADGPILLTYHDVIPDMVVQELMRLKPSRVYVLGGKTSMKPGIESRVRAALPAATVVRLGGSDRYAVALRVAEETRALRGTAVGTGFVVTGRTFADALSCAPLAAAEGWPIYLTAPGRVNGPVIAAMKAHGVTDVVIAGGSTSVPLATESALRGAFGASHLTRVGGGDRYAVSVGLADYAVAHAGFSWAGPTFASGVTPADALAGSVLAAQRASPTLLLAADRVPNVVAGRLWSARQQVHALTFFGGPATVPPHVRTETAHALLAPYFSHSRAMDHVRAIAGLGVRTAGSSAERKAADYVASQLASFGYAITTQTFSIPGDRTSRNVVAELPGSLPGVIVLGAHIDTKSPSPGANDNASGVGVTLELARNLALAETPLPTVRFVAFGAEEISGKTAADHHFGSRYYVSALSSAQKKAITSMVSIDMVGYGGTFNVRNLGAASMATVRGLREWAAYCDQPLPYLKDPSSTGWSDHEAFEFAGISSAWLQWRSDPVYHTARDTASHVQPDRVRRTGRLVRGWLIGQVASADR
ncbi:MAG: cell wall-binding repeat-containing protein [Actinomycetota bacterium]|nr:cell wall-binding repeat-containing protein [Actinomycetota bacterium]